MRVRDNVRFLLALVTAGLVAAACSSGGGGDDSTSPTPSPSPYVPTNCQVIWATRQPTVNVIDYYVIDAPISTWVAGISTAAFFQGDPSGVSNVTGGFVDDFNLVTRVGAASMVATGGNFDISLGGTDPTGIGKPVTVSDSVAQHYFRVDTAGNLTTDEGASGTGSFTGVWSDPNNPAQPSLGTGTVAILFEGSNLTMGSDLAYGQCYQRSSFTAGTRTDALKRAGNYLATHPR